MYINKHMYILMYTDYSSFNSIGPLIKSELHSEDKKKVRDCFGIIT